MICLEGDSNNSYGTTLKDYLFGISAGDGKYDASILRGLKIIRVLYLAVIVINVIFGLKDPIDLVIMAAVIAFHTKSLISSVILFTQRVSIVPVAVLRVLQVILSYFFLKNFKLFHFIFILLADVVYIFYLLLDKANYEYIREDAVIEDEI